MVCFITTFSLWYAFFYINDLHIFPFKCWLSIGVCQASEGNWAHSDQCTWHSNIPGFLELRSEQGIDEWMTGPALGGVCRQSSGRGQECARLCPLPPLSALTSLPSKAAMEAKAAVFTCGLAVSTAPSAQTLQGSQGSSPGSGFLESKTTWCLCLTDQGVWITFQSLHK